MILNTALSLAILTLSATRYAAIDNSESIFYIVRDRFAVACGTVEIVGEERILACPRDVIQYTCHVGSSSCITWGLYCPQQDASFTPNIGQSCNGSEQFSCFSNGVVTMFNVEVTYSNSELNSGPHSNITIQILNSSIPESGLMDMKFDCEDSRQYRYLSFAGTHIHVTISVGTNYSK